MEKYATLISVENLKGLRWLKANGDRSIVWHINRALKNYLKSKKVLGHENKK